jgi:hypothetical protein
MGRGVLALRDLADFLGARPLLPAVTSFEVAWSIPDQEWQIKAHAFGRDARDMAAWTAAVDDAVTTREPARTGTATRLNLRGTVHGHPIRVWCLLDGAGR